MNSLRFRPFAFIAIGFWLPNFLSMTAIGAQEQYRLDRNNGSMTNVPATRQYDMGTCYANTAAQMIDAYRFSMVKNAELKNPAHHTSPLAAALVSAEDRRVSVWNRKENRYVYAWEGGNVCGAVESITIHGSCDQRVMSQVESLYKTREILDYLTKAHWEFLNSASRRALAEDIRKKLLLLNVPEKLVASVSELESAPPKGSDFIMTAIGGQCRTHSLRFVDYSLPTIRCDHLGIGGEDRGISEIIKILRIKGQPVAISYCSNILTEGKLFLGVSNDFKVSSTCSRHASIIIGYRQRANRLEFLVRNSWDPICSLYSTDWDCEENSGNIWIDAEALTKNMYEASHLTHY